MLGRRPRLTRSLARSIAHHVRNGLPNKDAARLAGIGESTFYRWIERGEEAKDDIYQEFMELLKESLSSFKRANLDIIQRAADTHTTTTTRHIKTVGGVVGKDGKVEGGERTEEIKTEERPPLWTPAAWLLERRFPAEFGRTVLEHAGRIDGAPDDGPRVIKVIFVDEKAPGAMAELKADGAGKEKAHGKT